MPNDKHTATGTRQSYVQLSVDSHFLIEKKAEEDSTATHIRRLSPEESDRELARLLGAGEITPAALENAREMKQTAEMEKHPAV